MENSTAIKGEDYAAQVIAQLRAGTPNAGAREALAKAALSIGNYTQAAKLLWQDYLNEGCPK